MLVAMLDVMVVWTEAVDVGGWVAQGRDTFAMVANTWIAYSSTVDRFYNSYGMVTSLHSGNGFVRV